MKKELIYSENAPEPVGPYSQAIQVGGMLFCSGQIPIDPVTGAIPEGIEAQTRQVLKNLVEVLKAGGGGYENVVKTTVFLQDMNDFPVMNMIYAESFRKESAPARSTVQVAKLPKNVKVEIEAIAVIS